MKILTMIKIATAENAGNLQHASKDTDINHVSAWTDIPERLHYAVHNAVKITIATEIKRVSLENVKTLVQVHVASMQNAPLQITCLVASVTKDTKAIHMNNAITIFLQYLKTKHTKMIPYLVPNVDTMLNVKSERKAHQSVANA